MNINILVYTVLAIWPAFCDNPINCYQYDGSNWRKRGFYCIYARNEAGTERRSANGSLGWKLNFKEEDTPMNKCVKPPGLAAFKRCKTVWCNSNDCKGVQIVSWPETPPKTTTLSTAAVTTTLPTKSITSTSTAASTTLATVTTEAPVTTRSPTTSIFGRNPVVFMPNITNELSEPPLTSSTLTATTTTPEAVITETSMATRTPSLPILSPIPPSNGTSITIIGPICETGKQNNQSKPLGVPLTNVFDNEQVNVVYNIPSTSNKCECRCSQKQGQNTFVMA